MKNMKRRNEFNKKHKRTIEGIAWKRLIDTQIISYNDDIGEEYDSKEP